MFSEKQFFGVKKSKFANRLKLALPKFRGDRSEVRGVNGRAKFVAASAGRAERKNLSGVVVQQQRFQPYAWATLRADNHVSEIMTSKFYHKKISIDRRRTST